MAADGEALPQLVAGIDVIDPCPRTRLQAAMAAAAEGLRAYAAKVK